jgi:predicted nucleic acid-binding protein
MTGAEVTEICTSVVTIAGLLFGYLSLRAKTEKVATTLEIVRTDVNSNLTAAQNRNAQLTASLTAAAIDVPPVINEEQQERKKSD